MVRTEEQLCPVGLVQARVREAGKEVVAVDEIRFARRRFQIQRDAGIAVELDPRALFRLDCNAGADLGIGVVLSGGVSRGGEYPQCQQTAKMVNG